MSELTDLNATGNGLSAISGGLQGLLEAYKMKMAQDVQQAKVNQQGLDAGAQARMMMPYRMMMADQGQQRIDLTATHNFASERTSAAMAGISPDGTPSGASIAAREILAGRLDPNTVPKRGAFYNQLMQELDKQSQGNPDLLNASEAAKSKMFEANPTAQRIQRSGEAMVPLIASLKKSIGYNETTGKYDGPTDQSNIPMWNKIKQGASEQMGSATFTPTQSTAMAIQKELNMIAANGGSDKNLAMAQEMIKPTSSPAQLQAGIATLESMVGGRSTAYGGANPFQSAPASPVARLRALASPGAPPAPAAPVAPGAAPGAPSKYGHLSDAEIQAALAGGQ